jgi:tRNA(adenine34) deaminase
MDATIFGLTKDIIFMQAALAEAQKAAALGEVPIGAVVVNEYGEIVATGHNRVESTHTQSAHAEICALAAAGEAKKDWRLAWHWIYVTLEPCSMCMGLIKLSRLAGVVYATKSPLFGYGLDNYALSSVYKDDAFVVISGIEKEQAQIQLQQFFKKNRL